jgi:hypothetical protein
MRTLPERLLLISLDDGGKPRDPRSSLANGLAGPGRAPGPATRREPRRPSAVPTGGGCGGGRRRCGC